LKNVIDIIGLDISKWRKKIFIVSNGKTNYRVE
jgi:hypothetical protein